MAMIIEERDGFALYAPIDDGRSGDPSLQEFEVIGRSGECDWMVLSIGIPDTASSSLLPVTRLERVPWFFGLHCASGRTVRRPQPCGSETAAGSRSTVTLS